MESSLRIARVGGINIGIHYTWLIAVVLISWTLAVGFYPGVIPGHDRSTYWVMGVASALLLFLSVLVHELSHSFVAKARGLPVESITLFIFGGVSNIRGEAEDPQDEFWVAVVGPLTSVALAGLFYGLLQAAEPGRTPVRAVLSYLATINLALAIFNIIPGFPLDGGRVLRSIVWGITGSLRKATNVAATVGQIVAFLIVGAGIFQIFEGNFLGGIWLVLIGWFLNSAAESARGQAELAAIFQGVRVRDVMQPEVEPVPPSLSVHDLVYEYIIRRGRRALPVVADGALVGIVTITDVKELPVEAWPGKTVADIMTRAPLQTIGPDADLAQAARQLAERDLNQLLVVDRGQLVGLLGRGEILRFAHLSQELRLEGRRLFGTQRT